MAVPTVLPFTVKEYLALEAVAEVRHEFCAGRILAMAGADPAHNTIIHNLHRLVGNALDGRLECRTLGSDQRVLVEAIAEYFYPDLLITCVDPVYSEPKPVSLTNPQVIVEVLSATTERYDRGDKWAAYRRIPTLTDYVMVASTRIEVEHLQRGADGSWISRLITNGSFVLTNGVTLELAALYRQVELAR